MTPSCPYTPVFICLCPASLSVSSSLSVLESTNNDHDRALDVLLGMNDPSFVSPNPPPPPVLVPSTNQYQAAPSTDAQRLSQEALDEQLARRLALEEQQAVTQPWQPQGVEGQTMYQAYQPRRGRNSWAGQSQGQTQIQGQGGNTMTEFQEGFNRIAECTSVAISPIRSLAHNSTLSPPIHATPI